MTQSAGTETAGDTEVRFRTALLSLVLALTCVALSPKAAAMEFLVVKNEQGQRILLMYGSIEQGDGSKFRSALGMVDQVDGFWLSSGGGMVTEAEGMGSLIWESRLPINVPSIDRIDAAVANAPATAGAIRLARAHLAKIRQSWGGNKCMSACGMLLASGYIRFVDAPYSVGLHSAYIPAEKLEELIQKYGQEEMNKLLQQDFQKSGVKAATYMQSRGVHVKYAEVAASVPARCMYFLSASEMDFLNVVNVQGHKTAGAHGSGRCSCSAGENARQCENRAKFSH